MNTTVVERATCVELLNALSDVLGRVGLLIGPLVERAGLSWTDLSRSNGRLPARAASVLVADAVRLTGMDDLPLRIGAHCGLRWAGAFGTVARYAATVGEALRDLERAPEFQDAIGSVSLTVRGDAAHLAYLLEDPGVPNVAMVYDMALAAMCSALRDLSGGAVVPYLVRLPCPRPRVYRAYRAYLGPHLMFNALGSELLFPAGQLSLPNRSANAVLRQHALREATREIARSQPLVCVLVRHAIHKSLARGDCSRATVAAQIGVHERALGRRLTKVGVTFQDLLNEERKTRASILLSQTSAKVDRIARALGYRDSTVFGRAFRRWTGMLPTDFREQSAAAATPAPSPNERRALADGPAFALRSPDSPTPLAHWCARACAAPACAPAAVAPIHPPVASIVAAERHEAA